MLRMTKKIEFGTFAHLQPSAQVPGCRRFLAISAVVLASLLTAHAQTTTPATTKIGPAAPVTYDNKYEVYGSLNYMNFQAGQNLPKKMNLGGAEIEGTYWITRKWGAAAEYRGEAGTTQVFPNAAVLGIHRPVVYMNMALFGAQYRGPKNQYAAVDFHAYGGISHGVFDAGTAGASVGGVNVGALNTPAGNANYVGLYSNRNAPLFALGSSLDFNRSKNWALRLSPDLILEHFGTETRTYFSISGGIVYRVPLRKKK